MESPYYLIFILLVAWKPVPPKISTWNGNKDFFFRLGAANFNEIVRSRKNEEPTIRRINKTINIANIQKSTNLDLVRCEFMTTTNPPQVMAQVSSNKTKVQFRTIKTIDTFSNGLYYKDYYLEHKLDKIYLGLSLKF